MITNHDNGWANLDDFAKGAVAAALFTADDEIGNRDQFDIDGESLAKLNSECQSFQRDNAEALDEAYACVPYAPDEQFSSAMRAGMDFWFTRNHHGCGYWDRGFGRALADHLTTMAHQYRETDLYRGDNGRLYFS